MGWPEAFVWAVIAVGGVTGITLIVLAAIKADNK